jgi:hypothetical protein
MRAPLGFYRTRRHRTFSVFIRTRFRSKNWDGKKSDEVELVPTAVYSARQASTNSSKTFVAGSPVVPRLSLTFL